MLQLRHLIKYLEETTESTRTKVFIRPEGKKYRTFPRPSPSPNRNTHPINVGTVRHFITVNPLDTVESGYSQTQRVSTNYTLGTVEFGHYLYHCADW